MLHILQNTPVLIGIYFQHKIDHLKIKIYL